MNRTHARNAFSTVQILVVLFITTLLSSMTLTASRTLETGSKNAKTQTIISTISKGLALTVASRGGLMSPSEHPLAGSRPGRTAFCGVRGRHIDAEGQITGGEFVLSLDQRGEAITGVEEWYLASDRDRVLMPDDHFADAAVPAMYGMRRDEIGILGDPQQAVTRYRRLMRPQSPALELAGPYDATAYPDRMHLVAPDGTQEDGRRTFDYLFGNSNVQSELNAMRALYAPANDLTAMRLRAPEPVDGLDNGGRIWSSVGKDPADGELHWRAGLIQEGVTDRVGEDNGKPDWKPWRVRELAVYDGWDREIFYAISSTGATVLSSAGADGVFRWMPGMDGVYSTPAGAIEMGGDDIDASLDNIRQEVLQ